MPFPPPLLFVLALGAGWLVQRQVPLPLLPASWRAVGVVLGGSLIALWLGVSAWAMLTFARAGTAIMPNRAARRLVTSGPYRLSRNPMYVSLTVLHLGVTLLIDSAWPALFLLPALAALSVWVVRREERYLAAAFGDEYESYRANVRRWL